MAGVFGTTEVAAVVNGQQVLDQRRAVKLKSRHLDPARRMSRLAKPGTLIAGCAIFRSLGQRCDQLRRRLTLALSQRRHPRNESRIRQVRVSEVPATTERDAFGRIYEYFLAEFASSSKCANVHGRILDPAY